MISGANGENKPVVVGIGELLWDCFPGVSPRLGGATANVAFHAAQLGAEGVVVSRVGTDDNGDRALQTLRSHGLTADFVQRDKTHPTGVVQVALSLSGQPTYTICENVAWDFLEENAALTDLAGRASAVVFGSLAQRNGVSQNTILALVRAVSLGAMRLFDINLRQHFYTPETLRQSLALATHLKLNDEELTLISPLFDLPTDRSEAVRRLIAAFDLSLVALTLGANGAELYPAGSPPVCAPALLVEVVDTVGAGDAFTATLLVGLLQNLPLAETVRRANKMGGFVAGQSGAMPVLPPGLWEKD